jgi:hypothetical protein
MSPLVYIAELDVPPRSLRMDGFIARAQAKREWHLEQARKLEAFLATYYDLEQELKSSPPADAKSDAQKADAPKRQRQNTRPHAGLGLDTIIAAESIVLEHGPMSTRDMLPLILARGIEVGGRDPVATLSARISGRGDLYAYSGKWYFENDLPPNVRQAKHAQKEEANNPAKDPSASSLFASQGDRDGPPLAN